LSAQYLPLERARPAQPSARKSTVLRDVACNGSRPQPGDPATPPARRRRVIPLKRGIASGQPRRCWNSTGARPCIAASSGGTDKYYDQIAWFQDGNLAKLTLEYKTAGSFLWTDHTLKGLTNPSKKARISDHYPLWVEFGRT